MNKQIIIRSVITIFAVFVVIGMLLPDLSTPQHHIDRNNRIHNLRQIVVAICDYESEHGYFPIASENGLSWRVSLLPCLGEKELYDQIDKSVAWDHPNNLKIQTKMPTVFSDPTNPSSTTTPYTSVSGEGTVWPSHGIQLNYGNVLDGSSNTICVVALSDNQTNWMAPDSLSVSGFVAIKRQSKNKRICYGCLDGSVHDDELPDNDSELRSLFLIDDQAKPAG